MSSTYAVQDCMFVDPRNVPPRHPEIIFSNKVCGAMLNIYNMESACQAIYIVLLYMNTICCVKKTTPHHMV